MKRYMCFNIYAIIPSRNIYYYYNWICVYIGDLKIKFDYYTFEKYYDLMEIYFNSAVKFNKKFFFTIFSRECFKFFIKKFTNVLHLSKIEKKILYAARHFHNFF